MQPRDLLDATLLFLDRHEEALDPADPRRALEACEGLHRGLCDTLAPEIGAHLARTGEADAARALAGDALAREACAASAVRKRVSEAEGVLMHLQLTLRKGSADGPALGAWQRRVAHESMELRAALSSLRGALRAWAGDASRAQPRDSLRLARAALAAGHARAAGVIVLDVLRAFRVEDEGALRACASDDAALVWRAHDVAQRAVDVQGMPVVPSSS